jgi:hypothetical protein
MMSIRRERNVHAQHEYVRREKGNQKTKTEGGSQTGLEDEETESRHQTGWTQERAGFGSRELRRDLARKDIEHVHGEWLLLVRHARVRMSRHGSRAVVFAR